MIIEILLILIGFILGYITSSIILSKQKFIISLDNKTGKAIITPVGHKGKIEFIGEATEDQLVEMSKPTGLKKFFEGIKKPAQKEEDDYDF